MASETSFNWLEQMLRAKGATLSYPPTPDFSRQISIPATTPPTRTKLWIKGAVVVVFFIMISVLAIPQARAALVEVLRLGAVRIFTTDITPTPALSTTPIATRQSLQSSQGATLTEAITAAPFPLKWPTYPTDLGQPDTIFIQYFGEPVFIMVWLSPANLDTANLILYQMASDRLFLGKFKPPIVEETEVQGQIAFWTTGPYNLQFFEQGQAVLGTEREVESHGLIWQVDGVTYRLEGDFSREVAVQIAESLRPIPAE